MSAPLTDQRRAEIEDSLGRIGLSHASNARDLLAEIDRLTVELDRHTAERDRYLAHIERNRIRWCRCSRADRMHERANPACPWHGDPVSKRLEDAEAERDAAAKQALGRVSREAEKVQRLVSAGLLTPAEALHVIADVLLELANGSDR